MSDARLRALERELDAHPTPAARDRLAAERARRGDGPWLPALVYVDPREEARMIARRLMRVVGISPDQFEIVWSDWVR